MCCVELWCAVLYCVILYRIAYSVRESKSPAVSKNRKIRAKVDSRIYGRWRLQVMCSCFSTEWHWLYYQLLFGRGAREDHRPDSKEQQKLSQHQTSKSYNYITVTCFWNAVMGVSYQECSCLSLGLFY